VVGDFGQKSDLGVQKSRKSTMRLVSAATLKRVLIQLRKLLPV